MDASTEERELLLRTASGDEEAFTMLYRRHHRSIYRFAYMMTGTPAAADDVTQEVFIVLMKQAKTIDLGRGTLIAFLYGVARNHVLRHLREAQRFAVLDEQRDQTRTATNLDLRLDLERLKRAVLSLPEIYRAVTVLCDFEGLTQQVAASVLELPPGTIASRLHRAHRVLARKLNP